MLNWWFSGTKAPRDIRTQKQHLAMGLKKALEAEKCVADILKSHDSIIHVWKGKRVPRPDTMHSRGEIDVIALAKNGDVFSVEVKNWCGIIFEADRDVVQSRLFRKGKSKPVLPKIVAKSECLKRYLNSKTNSKWLNIHSLLVLANEFAEPSREVLALDQVATIDNLLETIGSKLTHDTHLCQSQIDLMVEQINSFNTYDTLVLADQDFKQGDITSSPWDRAEYEKVEIQNARGRVLSILLGKKYEAIGIDYDGNSKKLDTDVSFESITFSEPWRNGNSVIPLQSCKTIQFGGKTEYSYQKVPKTQGKRIRANIVATNATNNTTFVKGQKFFDRAILTHLVDKSGQITGMLIELDPDHRPALLNISQLRDIDCSMFEFFFAKGKSIDVEIKGIKPNGDIYLRRI